MKYTAQLIFPYCDDENKKLLNVKVSTFENPNIDETIEIFELNKVINFNPNFLQVIDADFDFNGEPYYDVYDFNFLKIQFETRDEALLCIQERFNIEIYILKQNNKQLKEDIKIALYNNAIYQLKKNEVVLKPNLAQII